MLTECCPVQPWAEPAGVLAAALGCGAPRQADRQGGGRPRQGPAGIHAIGKQCIYIRIHV